MGLSLIFSSSEKWLKSRKSQQKVGLMVKKDINPSFTKSKPTFVSGGWGLKAKMQSRRRKTKKSLFFTVFCVLVLLALLRFMKLNLIRTKKKECFWNKQLELTRKIKLLVDTCLVSPSLGELLAASSTLLWGNAVTVLFKTCLSTDLRRLLCWLMKVTEKVFLWNYRKSYTKRTDFSAHLVTQMKSDSRDRIFLFEINLLIKGR